VRGFGKRNALVETFVAAEPELAKAKVSGHFREIGGDPYFGSG
jgi:hypothetical protein